MCKCHIDARVIHLITMVQSLLFEELIEVAVNSKFPWTASILIWKLLKSQLSIISSNLSHGMKPQRIRASSINLKLPLEARDCNFWKIEFNFSLNSAIHHSQTETHAICERKKNEEHRRAVGTSYIRAMTV